MKESKIMCLVMMIVWLLIGLGGDHLALAISQVFVAAYWVIHALEDIKGEK